MRWKQHIATLLALVSTAALAVYLGRSAPAPEGQPDPATRPLEYRPGAYFPEGFPLHGQVRLLTSPVVEMGQRTRVKIEYRVGGMPIEEGMSLEVWKHFTSDVEQFQVEDPGEPAYFGVDITAAGIETTTRMFTNFSRRNTPSVFPYRKAAAVKINKGRLDKGDKVTFDLGAAKGVRMQHYEENLFNFRIAITRDDKVLGYGGDANLKVTGGPLDHLKVQAPSIVALGEEFAVEAVPQDEWGSLARDFQGLKLRITSDNVGVAPIEYDPALMHYVARKVVAPAQGTLRIEVGSADGRYRGLSNPVWVERYPRRRVFYGDLHQHTYLHDGRGIFEELYLYARRVGLLDFGALTPHHMPLSVTGPRYYVDGVSNTTDYWPELAEANKTMKGWQGFVPILGYEYSVRTADGGHHNVYYNADEAPTTMHLDPSQPMAPIGKMLDILQRARTPALVIPHIGGGPPDWTHRSDPRTERLFEVASVHGVFEESYQKHLEAGLRLAASASGDTHTTSFGNAYPGLIYTMTNALTGVYAYGRSRDEIWDGLYQKRTFGVTGNTRILMALDVNGEPMGGELPLANQPAVKIRAKVSGTAPLVRLELLKNSEVIHTVSPSHNRGRLLRVSWGDNIYQRRAVEALATGELSASAGRVRLQRILQNDQAFEDIRQAGDRITWRTATTSNDRDPFLADLSEVTGDRLHFKIEDPGMGTMEVEIPLDVLDRDGRFVWRSPGDRSVDHAYMKKMGVKVMFTLDCELVNEQGPMDYEVVYEDREELKSGDYYYLRVEQLDSNRGWTTPVWIN